MNVSREDCEETDPTAGHFWGATESSSVELWFRFCVLRFLALELVSALLSSSSPTDIPLLPGSPRRLSSRTVARGSQGPKHGQQYLKVPGHRAPGQRDNSSLHPSQVSRRESSRDRSVSTDGCPMESPTRPSCSLWLMCADVKSSGFWVECFYLSCLAFFSSPSYPLQGRVWK